MAMFNWEKKDGIQIGAYGDECIQCRRNRNPEDVYEPKSLEREFVYKMRIYGNEYCLCKECFLKTLGDCILLEPEIINNKHAEGYIIENESILSEEPVEEKKQQKKQSNKKKDEGEQK